MLFRSDDPEGWYGEGGGRRVQDGEDKQKEVVVTGGVRETACLYQVSSSLLRNGALGLGGRGHSLNMLIFPLAMGALDDWRWAGRSGVMGRG